MPDMLSSFSWNGLAMASLAILLLPQPGMAGMPGGRGAQHQARPPVVMVASSKPAGLPADLVQTRKRMVAKKSVRTTDLRRLADLGDAYAAWILAERLAEQERWDLTADIAHYYAITASGGRVGGIRRLMQVMERPEFADVSPARLAWLEKVMVRYAQKGTPGVTEYLIDAYASGHPFGAKPDAAIALLENSPSDEAARIALALASDRIRRNGVNADTVDEIRDLLDIAAKSDTLQARITSQNLRAVIDQRMPTADTAIALETGGPDNAIAN